ncbi:hypothetical protein Pmar_PMAR009418 [Perkinsus marinus ATCC 50983]|uniref:Carboxypeptidase n=1 Tax=Perkinsus marinus (strain ATCC 50983 / TXsc) TaxID=423536 RepID=C5KL15_PERM5|nr:hypothetical protein Pmar_PMAR009418 [Perkinsus marinus ATCC 50983]EER14823.1 hypothetical protein Pmar_PMAR009418 [Perkinsus marinus ATCC 50983]|eukprot:XP_002783027.1 hypothetical protein Pmar_PMAR009418 [Perkinsus marinus ATCC 50983]
MRERERESRLEQAMVVDQGARHARLHKMQKRAIFSENPFLESTRNSTEYSWNTRANLLYVDQPAGTGFSVGPFVNNGSFEAADDLYMALQEFFAEYTQYGGKDFYITGESYAGHYIPAIAHKIWRENTKGIEPHINLRGLAIGNGWMNAAIQKDIQKKLGVDKKFKDCSLYVGKFSMDRLAPFDTLLPDLLDAEIKVLLYAGDQDYICNWIGYEHVADAMDWPGRDAFLEAPRYEYEIYRAGHFVPIDQPEAAHLMISDFLDGTLGRSSSRAVMSEGSPEL